MGPLDVKRFFDFPVVGARPARVGRGQGRRLAVLIEHRQERRRRAILLVERRPGGVSPNWLSKRPAAWIDVRVVVGIDDGDGLAGAVEVDAGDHAQRIDAIGGTDLGRRVGDRAAGGRRG